MNSILSYVIKCFLGACLLAFSASLTRADGGEVYMDFNHGLYSSEEWTITDNEMSARFSPHNRQHRFTYTLNKGVHSRVEHVSMDLQLCTTSTAANANVRIAYLGICDAYQLRTYPHEKLWKKRIHWQMSDRGIELLNSMGEVSVSINVYWDGHGVFQFLNLKIVPETRPGDTGLIHDEVDCDTDVSCQLGQAVRSFNWGQAWLINTGIGFQETTTIS